MPHIFINAECADMLYVYGFCKRSATAAVEEYSLQLPMCKIPNRIVFSQVFNTFLERGMLPSAHVSSEQTHQQNVEKHKNIL
jgi:hypothetical protein